MTDQTRPDISLVRRVALSYWTTAVLAVVVVAGHARWYARGGPAAEVISGLGAALVVLGVLIGAWSILRDGVRPIARQLAQGPAVGVWAEAQAEADTINQQAERHITRDLVIERVIAVYIVVVGTLLNGYGPVIARGLRHLYLLHATSMGHG